MSSMLVIKYGGHAMTDESGQFAAAISAAMAHGLRVVVVHGGGPQINASIAEQGITPRFIGGFRYTDSQTLKVVEDVLTRQVGPAIADQLNSHGIAAKALSGRSIIAASKLTHLVDGTPADLGFVGEVSSISTIEILDVLESGKLPVISPVATEVGTGHALNINADLAAAAIAGALDAEALVVMTDVAGIYRSWPDKTSLIDSITAHELHEIKDSFTDGMAPKVAACLEALNHGARAVRIIDGTDPQAFALALDNTGGTLVTA